MTIVDKIVQIFRGPAGTPLTSGRDTRGRVRPRPGPSLRLTEETSMKGTHSVIASCVTVSALAVAGAAVADPPALAGSTHLFIRPPWEFRVVDALLTNFHLPRSSLLCLVAALSGRERILDAYAEAVREGYRFYSYGDATFLERGDA